MKEHDLYKEITDDMISDIKDIEKRCLLEEGKVVNMKKHKPLKKRTIGIVAAVACVVLICTPVMAKEVVKLWNKTVANMFGADKIIQEQYQDTNLTQVFETSEAEKTESAKVESGETKAVTVAENDGITVTLTQTLADDYSMYIYLDVKTDGKYDLTGWNAFEFMQLYVDGEIWDGYDNAGGGFVEDEYAISDYERGFKLYYQNYNGINLTGHDMKLKLDNFQADAGKLDLYTIVEGSWVLQWKVEGQYCGEIKTVDLNDTVINAEGGTYTLKAMDISPISDFIHYENQGIDSFEVGALNVAFIMKDGTIYDDENNYSEDRCIGNGAGSMHIDGELRSFTKVLNLSELKSVRINGTVFDLN